MHQKKILFIIPNLSAGGAQRIVTFLSKNLKSKKMAIKLVVLGFNTETVFDLEGVDVLYLNKPRLLSAIPAIIKLLIKEKPNLVFGSISHINIVLGVLSFFFRKIKFVAREASVVSKMLEFSSLNGKFYTWFMIRVYKNFSKIICQSQDMKNDFMINHNIASDMLVVINNPITENIPIQNQVRQKECVKFVTVGRLSSEKGHLRILDCLKEIVDYDFVYFIIGDGPLKEEIQQKVHDNKLEDKVRYLTFTSTVLEELMQCDYYLQGSYVEGFPNALLESCTVGTPVIAFNAPGGTKEIVIHGTNGYLAENEVAFKHIICDRKLLSLVSNREVVRDSVFNKFSSDKILQKYEELFENIIAEKNK